MAQSTSQAGCTIAEPLRCLREARVRTLDLVADVDDQQLVGPRLSIVNPRRMGDRSRCVFPGVLVS